MKTGKTLLTLFLVIAILALSIYGYSIVQKRHKEAQKAKAGKRDLAVTVQTGKAERTRIDEVLTFNGDIQALQAVDLQPKISGRLMSLQLEDGTPVEEGVRVRKGQLIGVIDERETKAQLSNAEASLSVAKANAISAEAALLNAKASKEQKIAAFNSASALAESVKAALEDKIREKNRQTKLLEQQATTQQSYDQAITAFQQATAVLRQQEAAALASQAQIRAADAEIKQAEANIERYKANILEAQAKLDEAQLSFSETRIYSPMDGVIGRKNTDPGSMVSPSTTIVTIYDMEEVKVLLSVPVNHLPRVVPGKTLARMRTASLPGRDIECKIAKIYPAVNTATRTAQVELRIKNIADQYDSYQLKPGMYATVEVLIESRDNVIAIDTALPIRNLDRNIVYVVDGDKARAVNVKLGTRFHSKVEVLGGLTENDDIVVVGQHRLTDGALLKVLPGNNLELSK